MISTARRNMVWSRLHQQRCVRHQIVAGGNLKNIVEERPRLTATEIQGVINRLAIPARGNARGEKCFHFRGKIECPFMLGVKKRLNAEAVAGGKKGLIGLVPQGNGKFAPQSLQTGSPALFI